MPERIQRKRTAGWRMPENARSVDRNTPYGNPFIVSRNRTARPEERWEVSWWPGGPVHSRHATKLAALRVSVDCFADWSRQEALNPGLWHSPLIARHVRYKAAISSGALRGKDVACWCGLLDPCHGDEVLKQVAESAPVSQEGGDQ